MRTVSDTWVANQAEIVSDPARLDATIESRGVSDVISQTQAEYSVVHPGGGDTAIGQSFELKNSFDLTGAVVRLSGSGSTYIYLDYYEYDPISKELGIRLGDFKYEPTEDFSETDIEFGIDWESDIPTNRLQPGYYALILYFSDHPFTIHYGKHTPYVGGHYISGDIFEPGMTENADADLYFKLRGQAISSALSVRASNASDINNAVEASITSVFDPSNATLPIESCMVKIMNNRYRWVG